MHILVVLMGSNPLPSHIVTRYLLCDERGDQEQLPKPNQIIVVHSTDTEKFACEFEKSTCQGLDVRYVNLEMNQRELLKIEEYVHRDCKDVLEGATSVHLNYTGGTKPMVLGVSRAVEGLCAGRSSKLIMSDVSPEDDKIHIVSGGVSSSYPVADAARSRYSLRDYVQVGIDDLLKWHRIKRKSGCSRVEELDVHARFDLAKLPWLFTEEAELILEKQLRWHDEFRDLSSKNKVITYVDTPVSAELKKGGKSGGEDKQDLFMKVLHETGCHIDELPVGTWEDMKASSLKSDDWKNICKYIDGTWLDEYIFFIIKGLMNNDETYAQRITDMQCNVKGVDNQFELDVVLSLGCELVIITCTTSTKKALIKSKIFEGVFRAQQLGGEHAKTISVSFAPDAIIEEIMQKDVSQFDAVRNVKLVGIEALRKDPSAAMKKVLDELM